MEIYILRWSRGICLVESLLLELTSRNNTDNLLVVNVVDS